MERILNDVTEFVMGLVQMLWARPYLLIVVGVFLALFLKARR